MYLLRQLKNDPKRAGIFLDYDGVISEIVGHPHDAVIDPEAKNLMERLSLIYALVAVVSGRSVDDVMGRTGIDNIAYAGSHGLEFCVRGVYEREGSVDPHQIQEMFSMLTSELSFLGDGPYLERKGISLAVHYRGIKEREEVIRKTLQDVSKPYPDFQILEGNNVLEIKPKKANKGNAVRHLSEDFGLSVAAYFGDDITDLDAFREVKKYGTAIAVLHPETHPQVLNEANFTVDGVAGVKEKLRYLLLAN